MFAFSECFLLFLYFFTETDMIIPNQNFTLSKEDMVKCFMSPKQYVWNDIQYLNVFVWFNLTKSEAFVNLPIVDCTAMTHQYCDVGFQVSEERRAVFETGNREGFQVQDASPLVMKFRRFLALTYSDSKPLVFIATSNKVIFRMLCNAVKIYTKIIFRSMEKSGLNFEAKQLKPSGKNTVSDINM